MNISRRAGGGLSANWRCNSLKATTLIDARFEYGEAAEEDVGPGLFTFYVTAYGYAAANIDGRTELST